MRKKLTKVFANGGPVDDLLDMLKKKQATGTNIGTSTPYAPGYGPTPIKVADEVTPRTSPVLGTSTRIPASAYDTKPAAGIFTKDNMDKVSKGIDKVTPYASNFINALRKPPSPAMPKLVGKVALKGVSYDAERNDVNRDVRNANMAADRGLDSQTAAAVQGSNISRGFVARSQSYERENNANAQISNQQAQMNLGVDAQNAAKIDQYNNDKTAMVMAHQREQSQNIANFSDKRVAEIDKNNALDLDKTKFNILSKVYGNGIVDRLTKRVLGKDANSTLTDADYEQATGIAGQRAYGGRMKKVFADGGAIGGPTDPVKPSPQADWNSFVGARPGMPLSQLTAAYKTQNPGADVAGITSGLNDANTLVRRLAIKNGMVSGANTNVGNQFPTMEVDATAFKTNTPFKGSRIPDDVDMNTLGWDHASGRAKFVNPQTGDVDFANQDEYYRVTQARKAAGAGNTTARANSVAKLAFGGPMMPSLSQRMPRMKGRLTKVKC